MKKVFYLAREEISKKENGYIADYKLLDTKSIISNQDDYVYEKIEVSFLDNMNCFGIKDKDIPGNYIGSFLVNTDFESFNKVVKATMNIDGYNTDILRDIMWFAFEGEEIEQPQEYAWF